MKLSQIIFPLIALAGLAVTSFPKENSKHFPFEQGGLPDPFMTKLIDDDGDGTPDRTQLYSIGPMFFNGYDREPRQEEIDWYRSQE